MCLVSCVRVRFSNIPCLRLLSFSPLASFAREALSQSTALATRGQQNQAELGLTQRSSLALGPGFSSHPGSVLFLGCLSGSCYRVVLLPPSLNETCCFREDFWSESLELGSPDFLDHALFSVTYFKHMPNIDKCTDYKNQHK